MTMRGKRHAVNAKMTVYCGERLGDEKCCGEEVGGETPPHRYRQVSFGINPNIPVLPWYCHNMVLMVLFLACIVKLPILAIFRKPLMLTVTQCCVSLLAFVSLARA